MNAFSIDIEKLTEICRENDVAMLGIFGSVARAEATEQSDIDLLVKFSERKGVETVRQYLCISVYISLDMI